MREKFSGLMPAVAVFAVLIVVPSGDLGASWVCRTPHLGSLADGFRYGFPTAIEKGGLVFAGVSVPITRRDVRYRIVRELNHLLQDRRSKLLFWLSRSDALKPVIEPILKEYEVPSEFIYLAAIESSFNSRSISSAGAYGYWQFIKKTATQGCPGGGKLDWKMKITNWSDERADLDSSTHAAARYLAWMNTKQRTPYSDKSEQGGFRDWLLTAAAYNAGPARVIQFLTQFKGASYWDVPLPAETERYVPRWIAASLIGGHRDFYGLSHVPHHKRRTADRVTKIKLEKDLTFADAAALLGTTPRELWLLNTHIAPETGMFPSKSGRAKIEHSINVPKGAGAKFSAKLASAGYIKKK